MTKNPPKPKRQSGKSGRNKLPGYLFRAPQADLDAWRDAATEAGETLAEWLREAARRRLESR
jgi:hypothetical protein